MQAQADPFHGGAQPHHCSVLGMGLGMGLGLGLGGWGELNGAALFCSLQTGGKKSTLVIL